MSAENFTKHAKRLLNPKIIDQKAQKSNQQFV